MGVSKLWSAVTFDSVQHWEFTDGATHTLHMSNTSAQCTNIQTDVIMHIYVKTQIPHTHKYRNRQTDAQLFASIHPDTHSGLT